MVRSVALSLFLFACGSGGGFPDAKPKDDSADPPGGKFRVNWSLVDLMDNTIACTDVSASAITGTMRNPAVAGGKVAVFSCGAGSGESEPIPPGTWDIDWELSAGSFGTISTAARVEDVVIESNKSTQLDPLVFKVDTTGGLDLHVTANKTGGNCGATGANGAGITGMTITLVHPSGGACEPAMLTIAAGATRPMSTYMIDCTTPMDAGCIENDQKITATGLPTGAYQIHIKGNVGATSCFKNDDQFSVPPAGKNLTRTLNLGPTGQPGC